MHHEVIPGKVIVDNSKDIPLLSLTDTGYRQETSAMPGTGISDLIARGVRAADLPMMTPPFVPSSGLLSDIDIEHLCQNTERPMITPFSEKMKEGGVISYGLSSYGYDARVAPDFKVFTNVNNTLVDPKGFDESCFVHQTGDVCIIPPNSFILCHTIEYFKMPHDVLAICMAKSTYARCGLVVGVTPLEPGWEGQVTIEISNTTPLPAKVYANEGVCQFLFFRGGRPCRVPYDARGGKYMGQRGVVLPRIYEEKSARDEEYTTTDNVGIFHHPV